MKIFQKTLKTIGIPVALLLILWGCARQPGTAPAAPGATAAPAASSQETAAAPDDSSSAGESASAQDVPAQEASYTSAEDVALYLHTYGTLPPNFVTKQEAREAGWDAEKGNLQDVLPGMSIGGDRFGNMRTVAAAVFHRRKYFLDGNRSDRRGNVGQHILRRVKRGGIH